MTEPAHIPVREHDPDLYASHDDSHTIFNEDLKELYQLSFLLTRDHEKVERCLVHGLEDCVSGNGVVHDWARSWAKRTIIQNAIRELKPRPRQSNSTLPRAIFPDGNQLSIGPAGHSQLNAVLGLEDFERFVFVMSVLERYSEHDSGLLLGCPDREIVEDRARAFKELTDSGQRDPFAEPTLLMQETVE